MMRRIIETVLVATSLFLFSCGEKESPQQGMAGSTDDTATLGTDTSATTTAITGGNVSALLPAEKEFLMEAAQASMAEVALGQMARDQATRPAVKSFGQRMIADHTKALQDLQQLMTLKGLALPTEPNADQQEAAKQLDAAADFDAAYAARMIADHEKAVQAFSNAAQTSQDADIRAFAAATLPVLQEHLQMARQLQVSARG